jgi:AcrR family transcriptional regulator
MLRALQRRIAMESSAARKGRPRSEKSRKAILLATNKLLLQTSVQELSIESIAKKAKVGKTTIYRWWPNKTAVVMDALASQPGVQTPLPTASSHREAIVMQLEKLIRLVDSNNGQTIAQLFSEAQASEVSLNIFKDNLLEPLMDAIRYSIEEGQRNGEFRKDIDGSLAVDMLCGPIFFRLMAHAKDLDESFRKVYPEEAVKVLSAKNAN